MEKNPKPTLKSLTIQGGAVFIFAQAALEAAEATGYQLGATATFILTLVAYAGAATGIYGLRRAVAPLGKPAK